MTELVVLLLDYIPMIISTYYLLYSYESLSSITHDIFDFKGFSIKWVLLGKTQNKNISHMCLPSRSSSRYYLRLPHFNGFMVEKLKLMKLAQRRFLFLIITYNEMVLLAVR